MFSLRYAVGKKGDIIITDTRVKRILGEPKHIVLKPRELAEKLIEAYSSGLVPPERLREFLEKTGESRSVSFYRVVDKPVAEKRVWKERTETSEKTETIMGTPIRWRVRRRFRDVYETRTLLSGRTETRLVSTEPVEETWEARVGGARLVLEKGPYYGSLTVETESKRTVTPEEVLSKIEEIYREAKKHTSSEAAARLATRIWLEKTYPEVARGYLLPPFRTVDVGEEVLRIAEEAARRHGVKLIVPVEGGVTAENPFDFDRSELSPAQRRILEMIAPSVPVKPVMERGPLDSVVEQTVEPGFCEVPPCFLGARRVSCCGREYEVRIYDNMVTVKPVPDKIEDLVSVIEAAITAERVRTGSEEVAEAVQDAYMDYEAIARGEEPAVYAHLLPRYVYKWRVKGPLGKEEEMTAVSVYPELEVPTRLVPVKKCYPTYGFMRDEECDIVYEPGGHTVIRGEPAPAGARPERPRGTRPTPGAIREVRRLFEERVLLPLARVMGRG